MTGLGRPSHLLRVAVVLTLSLLVLSGLLTALLGPWLDRMGRSAAEELSRRTGLEISIAKVAWRPLFAVALRQVRIRDQRGLSLDVGRIEVGFRPSLGLLIKPSTLPEHVRFVTVAGLRLDVDEPTLRDLGKTLRDILNRYPPARHVRVLFLDNDLRYRWSGGELKVSGVSGVFVPSNGDRWRLGVRAEIEVRTGGQRLSWTWVGTIRSATDGGWPVSSHEWRRILWNGSPIEPILWETAGTVSSWTLRMASSGGRLGGHAVFTQRRPASVRLSAKEFPLGAGTPWTLDVGLRWDGRLHGGLRARRGGSELSVGVTNGLLRTLSYRHRDGPSVLLNAGGSGAVRLGPEGPEAALRWRAGPAGGSLAFGPFRKDGKDLTRPFRLRIVRTKDGLAVDSAEGVLQGTWNPLRWEGMLWVLDVGPLRPRWEDWSVVSGRIRLRWGRMRVEGLALAHRDGRVFLEGAGRYVAASNKVEMRLRGGPVRVDGVWRRNPRMPRDVWRWQGTAAFRGTEVPLSGEMVLGRNLPRLMLWSPRLGQVSFQPVKSGGFRLDAVLDGTFPDRRVSWKGWAKVSGKEPDWRSWTAKAELDLFGWTYGPLRFAVSSWKARLEEGGRLAWNVVLAADPQRRTTWSMDGTAKFRPWTELEIRTSDGGFLRYVGRPGGKELVLLSGPQDLARWNAFTADGSRRFGGRWTLSVDSSGGRPWSMEATATNLLWDGLAFRSLRFQGRPQAGGTRLQGLIRGMAGGEVRLVDGLLRPAEDGLRFSSLWRVAAAGWEGDVDLTGVAQDNLVQARLELRSWRRGGRSLPRQVQFFRWERSTGRVRLTSAGEGLYAEFLPQRHGGWSFEGGWGGSARSLWSFRGTVARSGRMEVSMQAADVPLELFAWTLPVRSVRGTVEGELRLVGPWRRPSWQQGFVRVRDASFRTGDEGGNLDVRNAEILLRVAEDILTVERGILRFGRGLATVEGRVEMAGYDVADYSLTLEIRTNEPVFVKVYDDLQGFVDGRLSVGQSESGPSVRGRIFLRKAEVTFPFQRAGTGEALDMDLEILGREDVRYYQPINNIRLELRPGSRLRLKGRFGTARLTGEEKVSGRIEVRRGQIDYLGTTFQVNRAELVFPEDQSKPVPQVSLEAETRLMTEKGEVRVTLLGEGWLDERFQVRLVSTPALSQREIIALLGYGRLYDRVVVRSGLGDRTVNLADPTDEELNALLVAGVLTYLQSASEAALIRPLERRLARMTGLDVLEVRPMFSDALLRQGTPVSGTARPWDPLWSGLGGGRIIIGKRLTDFLFLEYMLSLDRSELPGGAWTGPPVFRDRHQMRMEVNLKALSLEWRYRPNFLASDPLLTGEDSQEWELRWQRRF